jgi:hypothetical protein
MSMKKGLLRVLSTRAIRGLPFGPEAAGAAVSEDGFVQPASASVAPNIESVDSRAIFILVISPDA